VVDRSVAPRLAIEGVWKSFGRRPILRNASVWAYPGDVTVLFGRNGEGKTTLIRCGLGLLRSGAGVTIIDGARARRASLGVLARGGLFFLPDRDLLASQYPIRRQFEALAARFPDTSAAPVGDGLIDPALLERPPADLSGGERRLVELAFAEARRPSVLIADEPLRELTPRNAETVTGRLRAIARAGCAVLVTGHETQALLAIADHVVWMTGGTTHHLGDREAALAHALFRRHYLSHQQPTIP
jgi:lipopolysaccharide export system ATP-binding protein